MMLGLHFQVGRDISPDGPARISLLELFRCCGVPGCLSSRTDLKRLFDEKGLEIRLQNRVHDNPFLAHVDAAVPEQRTETRA